MRLLHMDTIQIVAMELKNEDFLISTVSQKSVISHAWSEVLKFLATRQNHPKMFLNDEELGVYLYIIKRYGDLVGCNLNESLLLKYDDVWYGYTVYNDLNDAKYRLNKHFDNQYLFSDAVSLYLKGLNIFPYMFGSEWRKYVPIEGLKEIQRVVTKTLDKRGKK